MVAHQRVVCCAVQPRSPGTDPQTLPHRCARIPRNSLRDGQQGEGGMGWRAIRTHAHTVIPTHTHTNMDTRVLLVMATSTVKCPKGVGIPGSVAMRVSHVAPSSSGSSSTAGPAGGVGVVTRHRQRVRSWCTFAQNETQKTRTCSKNDTCDQSVVRVSQRTYHARLRLALESVVVL